MENVVFKGGLEGEKPFPTQGDSHVVGMWDNGLPQSNAKLVNMTQKA